MGGWGGTVGACGTWGESNFPRTGIVPTHMKTFFGLLVLVGGLVALAGCSTPETRIAHQPELFNHLTADQQQLIRQGRVGLGFTPEMVQLALGEPDRVRERIDANGRSEVWNYVEYEGADGAVLYTGWYHRGWGGVHYPYYLNVPSRHVRSRERVVFREGRVVSVEQDVK